MAICFSNQVGVYWDDFCMLKLPIYKVNFSKQNANSSYINFLYSPIQITTSVLAKKGKNVIYKYIEESSLICKDIIMLHS